MGFSWTSITTMNKVLSPFIRRRLVHLRLETHWRTTHCLLSVVIRVIRRALWNSSSPMPLLLSMRLHHCHHQCHPWSTCLHLFFPISPLSTRYVLGDDPDQGTTVSRQQVKTFLRRLLQVMKQTSTTLIEKSSRRLRDRLHWFLLQWLH